MTKAADKTFLHHAREKRGRHQEDVAKKFKVSQATVSHWETGKYAPHPSIWEALAREYAVEVADLFRHFKKAKAAS